MAAGTEDLRGGPDGHAVLFYSGGDELAGQVSEYLLEAIRTGGVAVVIATPAHRDSIAAALAGAGIDVAARQAAGHYVALDAFETMDQFMVADWPSAASFWQVVSPSSPGRPRPVHPCTYSARWLRCCGTLARSARPSRSRRCGTSWPRSTSSPCSAPTRPDSVRGGQHQDALAEVCRVHASVAGDVPGRA